MSDLNAPSCLIQYILGTETIIQVTGENGSTESQLPKEKKEIQAYRRLSNSSEHPLRIEALETG